MGTTLRVAPRVHSPNNNNRPERNENCVTYVVGLKCYPCRRLLTPGHVPEVSLKTSVQNLASGLRQMGFADGEFRASPLMRLRTLKHHIEQGRLSLDLRWQ